VKLVALVNDTTGALIASHYNDGETIIGAIFGTGCNAAYIEASGDIPKLKGGLPDDRMMAINCEYGAFDNERRVLPLTSYDEQIDAESPRPGEQSFEKMSAGLYLGEIYRLILLDLYGQGLLFADQPISKLKEPYVLDTAFLSGLEDDESPDNHESKSQFRQTLDIEVSDNEVSLLQKLAAIVTVRGARLCACGVAAICRKRDITHGHVAADGSVANKHPNFKKRWSHALSEILNWPEDRETDPITMTSAEDGSGVGAAVIAALALGHNW
jgi:hexokinase